MSDKDRAHCRIAGQHDFSYRWVKYIEKEEMYWQRVFSCSRCNEKETSVNSIRGHNYRYMTVDELLPSRVSKKKEGEQ